MSIYKIQGKNEQLNGIYYEFDSSDIPLGEGGMGKVYKGLCVNEKNGSSHSVAVKFMYDDLPLYAIEKARREAAIHFKHENLVEMLGFVETESRNIIGEVQHHYHVVSELLEGVSLDKFFEGKLTDQRGNFVPYAEKLFKDYQQDVYHFAGELIKNILSGLMTMHDAGFIHRDISPDNIMITTDGHIKLIDFGIAKKMNTLTSHDKHLTQAGQFVGKPDYAAPELVLGAIDEQNQTTDLYAVGILLFQCIVGHPPFEGDRADILLKQRHSTLPLKLIKNKAFRKIIAKATEKSRSKRYQSAAEFRVAIDLALANSNNTDNNNKILIFATVACTAIAFLISIILLTNNPEPPPIPDEIVDEYASAVNKLYSLNTYPTGLEELESMSNQGSSNASFLLSRLYFKSNKIDDYCPDSIITLQKTCNINPDNKKAHKLLEISVSQDRTNYYALYELACDYLGGTFYNITGTSKRNGLRTNAVEQNLDRADSLFSQALYFAKKANDDIYVKMITSQMIKNPVHK